MQIVVIVGTIEAGIKAEINATLLGYDVIRVESELELPKKLDMVPVYYVNPVNDTLKQDQ